MLGFPSDINYYLMLFFISSDGFCWDVEHGQQYVSNTSMAYSSRLNVVNMTCDFGYMFPSGDYSHNQLCYTCDMVYTWSDVSLCGNHGIID